MHLTALPALKDLFLYSPLVTDASLEVIIRITSLRLLDMQLCPNVSLAAFEAAMKIGCMTNSRPHPKKSLRSNGTERDQKVEGCLEGGHECRYRSYGEGE